MKPPIFAYADPRSVDETIKLLAEFGDDAKLLAGGQSLVPLLNLRLVRPQYLIDINRVTELNYIRSVNDGIAIGALTRQRAIERSELIRMQCPLLHEAIQYVGHVQIRNRGTIGGSLAHADPAAELPAVVTALGGRLRVRGPAGERWLSPSEFFVGPLMTALAPDELLLEVELPVWSERTGSSFIEFSRREGDFAIVGVAAILSLHSDDRVERVGLALTGVEQRPFDGTSIAMTHLSGARPDAGVLSAVAEQVASAIEPNSDIHAPAEYRRHLARVLTQRALSIAATRAQHKQS